MDKKNISLASMVLAVTTLVLVSNNLDERMMMKNYRDGMYDAIGNYVSPGGDESIKVVITIKDNIISEAEVTPEATRPMSVKFQGKFVEGYKKKVVGKNINKIKLNKVSGSSLTPKGFNDAIQKIKKDSLVS